MRWLRSLCVLAVAACGCATPGLRVPPRPPPPALDATFFETASTDAASPRMRVHVIDIGQGSATLVEFSCAAILIDTGGEEGRRFDSTQQLMTYLREFFASRPDLNQTLALLVLTHPHIDHTRAAPVVFGEYAVENLVTNGQTTSSGGKQQRSVIRAAKAKGIGMEAVHVASIPAGGRTSPVIDPVACADGDPDIRVLWGAVDPGAAPASARPGVPPAPRWNPEDRENLNNQSVAVRIALGGSSLLITGDLEEAGIEGLLARHAGSDVLDVDVYQVGHHGSYNATTPPLLRALTPRLALISCGPAERKHTWSAWAYGHPRRVTIDLLEQALVAAPPRRETLVPVGVAGREFDGRKIRAPIYATGWDSDVLLTMFADGRLAVRTRRGE